jgi:hypothetical protein
MNRDLLQVSGRSQSLHVFVAKSSTVRKAGTFIVGRRSALGEQITRLTLSQ